MKPLEELVRPNIRALKPYSTARDEFSGGEITTWLDANENPYDNGVNRYPDPHQKLLKQKIAALKGVREEQVFIGNGSDEAIDLCYRIFCRPGVDNAVSIAPTYGMYRVAADINDVEMREVPLGADFSLPADALLAAADERTRLLWLCSPNNPTGNAFPAAGIERLLREFDGMVVLDEAYIDFAAGPGFLARLGEFGNLIVLQTLSKAWGMAGLRLGLAFASEAGAADACALITDSWSEIAEFIRRGERRAEIRRETRETQITVRLDLDGRGDFNGQISTGLRFLDHMLAQIAHHGGVALAVDARGDLDIDEHHTMEDVAITLGEAVDRALGAKAGIARYGFALPMDDCRALTLLDFGGRIDFEWDASFRRERVGDVPTEMFRHFFHSFACAARCNLQISARGDNDHHKAEAVFKAFARALRMAVAHIPFDYTVPSSKGVL